MSKVPGPVSCLASVNQNVMAVCTPEGMWFYESKERRFLSQSCTQLNSKDEGLPDPDPVPKKPKGESSSDHIPSLPIDTEENTTAADKDKQPPKKKSSLRNLNASMVSFAQDPVVQASFWGTTADGRVIGFQLRGEKSRVRCTVLHDMPVAPTGSKGSPPVRVEVVKGYLLAMDSQPSDPTLAVYNLSGVTRSNPPEMMLIHHLDLESASSPRPFLQTDKHTGIVVGSGAGPALIWENKLPHNPPSDWNLSWLNMLRHPLLLGAVGMFFMWNMRKGKKDDGAAAGPDFDMAGAEAGLGAMGGLAGALGGG
eukprot:CAMPEP_0184292732 /NCGR_PEP_ID=MMETSP1049-20130417/4441_1 /TAXON_ID=77928 /ORGANISM="Proteomonas sulcata, Strain CCMP704" /LENGTH=309 /DNA_ID=CAMNT_0026600607 /DNA_START=62 /DNA_END=987 /DNA_ORIENTATION=-